MTENISDAAAPTTAIKSAPVSLGDDLLRGAGAIAQFLFGDRRQRRKVYYLTGEATGRMPHFRLGAIICARKSTLLRWIEDHERQGGASSDA